MSLTKSDHIRKLLERNFNLTAPEIVDRLAERGIEVTSGLVHVVKSSMRRKQQEEQERQEEERRQREAAEAQRRREAEAAEAKRRREAEAEAARQEQERLRMEQEAQQARQEANERAKATKAANQKPLRQFVAEALAGKSEGLTLAQIAEKVKEAGYVSNTEFFSQGLNKKLRLMLINNEITKDEAGGYRLKQQEQVAEQAAPAPTPPEAAPAPVAVNGLVGPDMIDPRLLVEVNKLVAKVGGADRLRTYVTTLEELQVLTQGGTKVS